MVIVVAPDNVLDAVCQICCIPPYWVCVMRAVYTPIVDTHYNTDARACRNFSQQQQQQQQPSLALSARQLIGPLVGGVGFGFHRYNCRIFPQLSSIVSLPEVVCCCRWEVWTRSSPSPSLTRAPTVDSQPRQKSPRPLSRPCMNIATSSGKTAVPASPR